MEKAWKWSSFVLCLLCFGLCNGKAINPDVSEIDSQTKLLTGILLFLLTIGCVIFIVGCLCCKGRQKFEKFRNSSSPVIGYYASETTTTTEHGHVNPIANGEFTIFSPLSKQQPPGFNNNVVCGASVHAKGRTVEDSIEDLYDVKAWFGPTEVDFPRTKLKYIKELGTGWFGKVVEGAAQDIRADSESDSQTWHPVVVRILEATSNQTKKILFLQDVALYRCGAHTNLLSLVGRSLDAVPFLVLQEYCPLGDLKRYLLTHKSEAVDKILSTEYPLIWCCQLTAAVKHIHQHNIVHHDLASRNCQLTSNLTLKLGDYGLGPYKYPNDYYQGIQTVPVRWCAPESLNCTQTTVQPKKIHPEANIWSLGVTMWEICECGRQPYENLTDDEVISQVLVARSVTLTRPEYSALYTDYIFKLMQMCWTSVESRPTASQIDLMLTDLLQVHRNTTYDSNDKTTEIDDFDRKWHASKPNTVVVKTDVVIGDDAETSSNKSNKSLSPSLTNLHGSFDDLKSLNDLSAATEATAIRFQRTTSSGSETEDENWRAKIERGAYTEKVRQKSKSVTDLMVLTHVDYSESDTETPLPSIDYYRANAANNNYRNVRLAGCDVAAAAAAAANGNLESTSITFGSEGNLLSVEDAFQRELTALKKLQEERKDSLLFVPDNVVSNSIFGNEVVVDPAEKLMHDLNGTRDITPVNQVYNVYNVTVNNLTLREVGWDKSINNNRSDIDAETTRILDDNDDDKEKNNVIKIGDVTESTIKLGSIVDEETVDVTKIINKDVKVRVNESIGDVDVDLINDDIDYKSIKINARINELVADIINSALRQIVTIQTEKINERINDAKDVVKFDVSNDQVASKRSVIYASTPFKKREMSLRADDKYSSLNIYRSNNNDFNDNSTDDNLDYSLETWDTFLGTSFDNQQQPDNNDMFDSFTSEPRSLLFIESDATYSVVAKENAPVATNASGDFDVFNGGVNVDVINDVSNSDGVCKSDDGYKTVVLQRCDVDDAVDDVKGGGSGGDDACNVTYDVGEVGRNVADATYTKEERGGEGGESNEGAFENGSGWFLHPQPANSELCGNIEIQSPNVVDACVCAGDDSSYIGFGIDDEIMSAIRNELITKLPQAQGANAERVKEEEDRNAACERNEVFLRYNVYNTPLSPIPEESFVDDDEDEVAESSNVNSPKPERDHDDWSGKTDTTIDTVTYDIENSPLRNSSNSSNYVNRHTPSQDSCCSNDTLFNLEELMMYTNTNETDKDANVALNNTTEENNDVKVDDKEYIKEFILKEQYASNSKLDILSRIGEVKKNVAPLPSPEDKPWKQLALLGYQSSLVDDYDVGDVKNVVPAFCTDVKVTKTEDLDENTTLNRRNVTKTNTIDDINVDLYQDIDNILDYIVENVVPDVCADVKDDNLTLNEVKTLTNSSTNVTNEVYDDLPSDTNKTLHKNNVNEGLYANDDVRDEHIYMNSDQRAVDDLYVNVNDSTDVCVDFNASYDDYVDVVNKENDKNRSVANDIDDYTDDYVNKVDKVDDIFGLLTDIRFTGPGDNQMMSTSFSEQLDVDVNDDDDDDEQGWDSGSDSRSTSTSSGEFIWKDGGHEESLKALRAAPQGSLDKDKPVEGIPEDAYEGSDISSSFSDDDDDEDEETPEFVPSAWDKFATPGKSALRSPEKTLNKTDERKPKGVWFKKQKYHCIYEYPKEPESPIAPPQPLHSPNHDLWMPHSDIKSISNWEFDKGSFDYDGNNDDVVKRTNDLLSNTNLYHLTSIKDFLSDDTNSKSDKDFFITGTAHPFHSQFFPGYNTWHPPHSHLHNPHYNQPENATPDSGVEDATPATHHHHDHDHPSPDNHHPTIPPLRQLASEALTRRKNPTRHDTQLMGGLRHTRNRLKLDLPPSINSLGTNASVYNDVRSQKPTFTTFGKSRFMVQHVDTPPDSNVSFEAVPYRPFNPIVNDIVRETTLKETIRDDEEAVNKIEVVRGEASLLDSGDEDSGIESASAVERKIEGNMEV